ncbi:hypothetical protein J6590_056013 [Homalodisca vitripennis]|nr:hypothetical protein J6590_056013 [Homalodisca vitripennis]
MMLIKLSNVATKDEIKAVSAGIGAIIMNLATINKKLDDLKPRLKATADRIDDIERTPDNIQASFSTNSDLCVSTTEVIMVHPEDARPALVADI